MKRWRISKYNPEFRDERGRYIKDEWTEYCEIGQEFEAGVFKKEDYFNVENQLVEAVLLLLEELNIKQLQCVDLWCPPKLTEPIYYMEGNEKIIIDENPAKLFEEVYLEKKRKYPECYTEQINEIYYNIEDGQFVDITMVKNLLPLLFRGHIESKLIHIPKLMLGFPGRMYIWVHTEKEFFSEKLINKILDLNLYVEVYP